ELALWHVGDGGGLADDRLVRAAEGVRVFLLVDLAHGGVAARLEHGDQPPARVLREDGGDGLAHGGGMVGEVVDHGHSSNLPAKLLPPFHTAEATKPGRDLIRLQSQGAAGGVDAEGVLDVVPAGRGERDADLRLVLVVDIEGGAGGANVQPARAPVGLDVVLRAVALHPALREGGEALPVWKGTAGSDVAVLRQEREELLERALV